MTVDFVNILDVSDDLIERVRNWRNEKSISQYMYTNHYITKEEHRQWIEKLKTTTTMKAWIIRIDENPVGVVSLTHMDFKNKTTEWGFYIADESFRGKGIGSITLYKLMEYVFETLRFQKMTTMVLENNTIAKRMYEKFGFKKDMNNVLQIKRNRKKILIFTMWVSKDVWSCIKRKYKNLDTITLE
jgi:UDP-4-amino-4,6-dideoxy-N-acetyl-beta-L-altrosamine N-acetyltransferase